MYKNVVGFGHGIKRKNGRKTGEPALIFFVEEKTSNLSKEDIIPDRVKGETTDVIQTGKISPLLLPECSTAVRQIDMKPIRGGIQIGADGFSGVGTLGAIVQDRKTKQLFALTNAHVAGNPFMVDSVVANELINDGQEISVNGTARGLKMYQSTTAGNYFGDVVRDSYASLVRPNRIDSSIISIRNEVGVTCGIMGLTKYAQTFQSISTVQNGQKVCKSGRTTGTTFGEIVSLDATVYVQVGAGRQKEMEHQIIITPDEGINPAFSLHGDSGSVVCVDYGNGKVGIIGQLHAGTEDGAFTVACSINNIVNGLDIYPWDGRVTLKRGKAAFAVLPDGSLYQRDEETFDEITNKEVCFSGTYSEAMESPCQEGIIVRDCAHKIVSGALYATEDVEIIRVTYDDEASVNCGVALSADCKAISGGLLKSEVFLDIASAISVGPYVDSEVAFKIDATSTTLPSAYVEADIYFTITADANAVPFALAESQVQFNIESHAFAGEYMESSVDMAITCDGKMGAVGDGAATIWTSCVAKGLPSDAAMLDSEVCLNVRLSDIARQGFSGEALVNSRCSLIGILTTSSKQTTPFAIYDNAVFVVNSDISGQVEAVANLNAEVILEILLTGNADSQLGIDVGGNGLKVPDGSNDYPVLFYRRC